MFIPGYSRIAIKKRKRVYINPTKKAPTISRKCLILVVPGTESHTFNNYLVLLCILSVGFTGIPKHIPTACEMFIY